MEPNNLDPFDQCLRHKLSGSAPTEVHQRAQQHFESLAAQMRQAGDAAASDHKSRARLPGLAPTLWRELIWPCRRIWVGLACSWLLIIGLNMASSEPSRRVVSQEETSSGEEIRALIEQRRMLAQMIGPIAEPAADRKSNPTGPRSDRTSRISAA
jgi:hypothetical protein